MRSLIVLALAAAPVGCSFIDSSKSISDSIGSSSASSTSSIRGDSEEAYRSDVRDYTYAYVISGGKNLAGYQKGIADLAGRHGVTNWQEDATTYEGMGQGLAKAKVNAAELEAYKQQFSGSVPERMQQIQRGYDSARA
jgi:hypothetical protein